MSWRPQLAGGVEAPAPATVIVMIADIDRAGEGHISVSRSHSRTCGRCCSMTHRELTVPRQLPDRSTA